jgi:hypothetical protein
MTRAGQTNLPRQSDYSVAHGNGGVVYYAMNFFVYIHKRATDGKIFYVGKGCRYRHKSKWARSTHWHNIVNKHGYIPEIVKSGLSEREAFELEVDLIEKYKCHGLCNRTAGGEGASGAIVSEKTRAKLKAQRATPEWRNNLKRKAKERFQDTNFRQAHIDRIRQQMKDPILRQKLRECAVRQFSDPAAREENSRRTKKFFENPKAREHARKKALERFDTPEKRAAHAQAKAILCVETGMIFGTGTLAAEWVCSQGKYKGDNSSIAKVCRGIKPQAYGHTWRYVTPPTGAAAKSSAG